MPDEASGASNRPPGFDFSAVALQSGEQRSRPASEVDNGARGKPAGLGGDLAQALVVASEREIRALQTDIVVKCLGQLIEERRSIPVHHESPELTFGMPLPAPERPGWWRGQQGRSGPSQRHERDSSSAANSRTQKRRQRLRGRRRLVPEAPWLPVGPAAVRNLGSPVARTIARRVHRRFGHRPGGYPVDARGIRSSGVAVRLGPSEDDPPSTGVVRSASAQRSPRRCRLDRPPEGNLVIGRTRSVDSSELPRIASRPFPRSHGALRFSESILAGCAAVSRGRLNGSSTILEPARRGWRPPRRTPAMRPRLLARRVRPTVFAARGIGSRGNQGGRDHVHRRRIADAHPDHHPADLDLLVPLA